MLHKYTYTNVYVLVGVLSERDNKKLSKLEIKGFERSLYWNEYETKTETKNTTNEYRYFLESNFVGVNRLFALVYLNRRNVVKRFKTRRHYLTKEIIVNLNFIINGKNFFDQAIDSDVKQYKEIRKLTIGQDEHYTTEYLLNYDYIKDYYRLTVVDLSRRKELDADPKAIQQIEFVGQLKKCR